MVVNAAGKEGSGVLGGRQRGQSARPGSAGLAATTSCHHREGLVKSFSQDTWVFFLPFKVSMKYRCKEVRLALRSVSHRG